jgi:mannose-6-phosphate isomerase-like protein (cupin superfamily)
MHTQSKNNAPIHERGGQSSYLLLAAGQFDTRNLAVIWVDCPPGSEQQLHHHETQEQVYVIIRDRGTMIVGDEQQDVDEGTLVVIPPRTGHAIRNNTDEPMSYVSATSPPFDQAEIGAVYKQR